MDFIKKFWNKATGLFSEKIDDDYDSGVTEEELTEEALETHECNCTHRCTNCKCK